MKYIAAFLIVRGPTRSFQTTKTIPGGRSE